MMKDIKLACSYLKYMPNKKGLLLSGIVFTLLGIVYGFVISNPMSTLVGVFLMAIFPMILIQLYQYIQFFDVAVASEKNYDLQTKVYTEFAGICALVSYLIAAVGYFIEYKRGIYSSNQLGLVFIWAGAAYGLFVIYITFAAKKMIVSSLVYCGVLIMSMQVIAIATRSGEEIGVQAGIGLIVGLVICLVCLAVLYFVTRILYNLPADTKMLGATISLKM